MQAIEDILNFVVEIEKLKAIQRKTKPVGLDRYENSAEHSWHICLTALMLKDYANEPVNIDRVIKMLLIHDIGEIDVGDTIIYKSETQALKQQSFDLCFTDMRLPDGNGLDIVRLIQKSYPNCPVAVITAHGNVDLAVEALKSGAFDFVSKPLKLKVLRDLVNSALNLSPL